MKTMILILAMVTANVSWSQSTVRDPYRVIGEKVYTITGIDPDHGWVEFSGTIWNVQEGGICIKGVYTGNVGQPFEGVDFFVANYPYHVADGETVQGIAKIAGTYTYPTAIGGTKTLRKLDYGTLYVPKPPTPEEIEAAKKAAAEKAAADKVKFAANKKAGEEKALAANRAAADKGDAYGLLRMGERYRDGDGVETNFAKAEDYFKRSAAVGSLTAAEELKRLH